MKSTYYEQADVLHLLLSDEPVKREALQHNACIGFSADDKVASIILWDVRREGLLYPQLKVPWPKHDVRWGPLLEVWGEGFDKLRTNGNEFRPNSGEHNLNDLWRSLRHNQFRSNGGTGTRG